MTYVFDIDGTICTNSYGKYEKAKPIYDKGFSCDYNLDDGIKQMIKVYNLIDEPWYANY